MATANQNLGKLGNTYSGIRAHAERTFKKHENENIDKTMSQFNQYGHMNKSGNLVPGIQKSNDVSKPMYRKLAEDYLRKTVNAHNRKVHSKTREWKLSDKINENKDKINRELLITIGNKATNEKQFDNFKNSLKNIAEHYGKSDVIEKGLKQSGKTYDEWVTGFWKKMMSKTLVNFVKEYNERHTALKITDYATNVDEDGAPHVHCRLITLGESVGGRRNFSLNGALYRESKDTDSRAVKITKTKDGKEKKTISSRYLMKKYRRNEDTRLINHVNRELKKTVNDFTTKILGVSEKEIKNNPYDDCYTVDFGKLERTGEKGGRSMEDYKELQKLKKEKEEAEKKAEEVKKERDQLYKEKNKTSSEFQMLLHQTTSAPLDYIELGYVITQTLPKGYDEHQAIEQLAMKFGGRDKLKLYQKPFETATKMYHNFEDICRKDEKAGYTENVRLEQSYLTELKNNWAQKREKMWVAGPKFFGELNHNNVHDAYRLHNIMQRALKNDDGSINDIGVEDVDGTYLDTYSNVIGGDLQPKLTDDIKTILDNKREEEERRNQWQHYNNRQVIDNRPNVAQTRSNEREDDFEL